jgi:DNA-binding response OmpR family regulator
MRVLIVEDSARLQRTLIAALQRSGYVVDKASDGEEGLWLADSNPYDAIVLDIMLPKRDGLSVLNELRKRGKITHVLLLTARDTVADRVQGLRVGADDYLVKPFALEELLARVEALCRRAYGVKTARLGIDNLELDREARRLWSGDKQVDLTAREYLIFEYLALRRGNVVSRSEIEHHIYDEQVEPMSNVVDSAICSLRKKLAATGNAQLIHTRRRLGYVLESAGQAAEGP